MDNATLVSIIFGILDVVLGALLYRLGSHTREVQTDIEVIKKDVNEFKIEVAKGYMTKDEIRSFMERVTSQLDEIQRTLNNKADRKG